MICSLIPANHNCNTTTAKNDLIFQKNLLSPPIKWRLSTLLLEKDITDKQNKIPVIWNPSYPTLNITLPANHDVSLFHSCFVLS